MLSLKSAESQLSLLLEDKPDISENSASLLSSINQDSELFSKPTHTKNSQGLHFGTNSMFLKSLESSDISLQRKLEDAKLRQQKLMDLGLFSVDAKTTPISDEASENASNPLFREEFNRFSSSESELKSYRLSDVDSMTTSQGKKDAKSVQKSTYQDFLHKLMHPSCELLVNALRQFLFSVLGPHGDGSPPTIEATDKRTKKTQPNGYEFRGGDDVQRRCADFLDSLIDHMRKHPFWAKDTVDELMFSRDCLERYITIKIYDVAFKSSEVPQEDEALNRRAQLLSFLTPAALDIKPELQNDLVFSLAQDKLKKINSYKAPADKVNCIVRMYKIYYFYRLVIDDILSS